jgi:hypothetical protein
LYGHKDEEPTDEMIEAAELVKKIADKKRKNKN